MNLVFLFQFQFRDAQSTLLLILSEHQDVDTVIAIDVLFSKNGRVASPLEKVNEKI